ncbi:hypothetical protein B0J14DRAFT_648254 [Halenospora varia]|nr:hypothetical protein B0J14DRAFT_648254 [Halenospora varia]
MCDTSPTKRRKTRGTFGKGSKMTWPEQRLPVEIFTLIISYLPRSNIQNMRLVNKEFEEKVSEYLFKVVVVPFKPEIYGIAPESSHGGILENGASDSLQGAVMLQDKGMRVFQGFGRRIRKFAMSFEFDENKLANPPIKSDQEAITAFWGIYRWPYMKYNRYAQLEGLEQTADETRTMAKALRYIECAKELGLSIDGGLGWLAGPDTNQKVVERGEKLVVFGESRFVPEMKPRSTRKKGSRSSDPTSSNSLYAAFERMLEEAGYRGETLEPSVRMLLETEDTMPTPDASQTQAFDNYYSSPLSLEGFRRAIRAPRSLENGPMALNAEEATTAASTVSDEEDIDHQSPNLAAYASKAKLEGHSLKPNDLTNAQREMLLEIEWAQRAFMQSYAIAVIDNPNTFGNIESLTIARLPNRHLPTLRREDFWDSLPKLTKLSLTIIPDWREVAKLPTSFVQDIKILPSQAVSGVHQLLKEQIARRKNIKTLHFAWLSGGEYAPGLFSRNQNILPAPLVPNAADMVNRGAIHPVLELPHVEHLSLKNCWISPHILERFATALRNGSCESFKLDSVSLCAPVNMGTQPAPTNGQAANHHNANVQNVVAPWGQQAPNNMWQALAGPNAQNAQNMPNGLNPQNPQNPHNIQNVQNGPNPAWMPQNPAWMNGQNGQPIAIAAAAVPQLQQVIATTPHALAWLEPPRAGSWAHTIDGFTPGITLADIRYARDLCPEPPARYPTRLSKIEFMSCGYVKLPLDFDQTMIDNGAIPAAHANTVAKRMSEIEGHMMKPGDHYVASIVNHISPVETDTLESAWNMIVGWGLSRSELLAEAKLDGISDAGKGRFDGLIEYRILI